MVVAQKSSSKDIESIYPISSMQQGMLFHTLYNPESRVYLSQLQLTIFGNLDTSVFEQAWDRVVERHPALRTLFLWKNRKQPLQVVRKRVNLPWTKVDLRSLQSLQQQQEQINSFLQSDCDLYFELDKAPLMRFFLFRTTDETYEFVSSSHHILNDGWSWPILLRETFAFYEAIHKNQELNLKPPRHYRDYITWLQQQDLSQAEAFWRQNLQGFTSPTPFVVDQAGGKSSHQHQTYNTEYFTLSTEATTSLKTFAQQHHLTFSTLVQAAWAQLLCRYSGESDVVFGATVSGRPPALLGVESMVGLFVNTLPVRVQLGEKTQLLTWLKQLQEQQVERDQYSYSPLVEIQGWSDVPRGQPLFESFVIFQNLPVAEALQSLPDGLQVGELEIMGHADYPLTLIAIPGEKLAMKIIYAGDRFNQDTIARMAGHFQTLLEAIPADSDRLIGELPLLTTAEEQALLVEGNATQTEHPIQHCIHELFEKQVEKTPQAVAIAFENLQLTYQELNSRANQLAHYLQRLGVGPDVPVGICLERSFDVAIAILATLKAGGACVPLDPQYPPERLAFMLQDTRVPVLLTQERWQTFLRCDFPHHLILLEGLWDQIRSESDINPDSKTEDHNLSHIVYSSGSTGVPKGIAIPHRSLTNVIEHYQAKMACGLGVLQFAPLSFDVSYHEMFVAWCLGGTLWMIPEDTRLDIEKLIHLIANNPIQQVIFPVTLWQQLAEMYGKQPQLFQNLQIAIAAGEQLQITQPIIDLFKQLKNCRLYNFYGPTEADVVTAYTFSNQPDEWPVYPPIGKPAVNVQVYLLDAYLQPVPVGVSGELYVSGAGLARGYFNRPELTDEKFIPNPFSNEPNSRLYKTGDVAKYLPDGNIEFLGRKDDLVKIRGYRVDLGEVEAVLSKHPQISQAVTTVHGDSAREKFLAAYFIPMMGQTVTNANLRDFLAERLPEYMIPTAFVQMESFPLSPNGKVNRRFLPIPTTDRPEFRHIYTAPRTPTEEILADIWREVLSVKAVGIDDNFFQLGGHSLKAIQMVSRIRQTFELEVTVRHLFNHPTVAELVSVLAELAGGEEIIHEIAHTLQQIAQLSPEQVQAMLTQEQGNG